MSQIGVACVRGLIPLAECRRCRCNPLHPCSLPADVLQEMDPVEGHRHNDPTLFSATSLLGCDRQAVLKTEHGYYVDVEEQWKLMRGTMVHSLFEKSKKDYPGAVHTFREVELRFAVPTKYGPQTFISQPDLIIVLPSNTEFTECHVKIVDYKSTGTIGHDLVAAKRDHVRQINMYAWLVRRALPQVLMDTLGLDVLPTVVVDEVEIFYCDMGKTRRFTSAGYLTARGKRISVNPKQYDELILEPIKLFPDAQVDAWITAAIEQKIAGRETLAPMLPEIERWKCPFCPVRQVCEELGE